MTAGIWFWLIFVLSLLTGGGWYWRNAAALQPFGPFGLIFFVLIGLLGFAVFGSPIR